MLAKPVQFFLRISLLGYNRMAAEEADDELVQHLSGKFCVGASAQFLC